MIVVVALLDVDVVRADHLDFTVADFVDRLGLLWVGEVGFDAQVDLQVLGVGLGLLEVDRA